MKSQIGIKIRTAILSVFSIVLVYLVVVLIWSVASVNELLQSENTFINAIDLDQDRIDILLKVEDPTFYNHSGIDVSVGQGLTTITSSIARDVFLFRNELTGIKGKLQSLYAAVFRCCKKVDFGRDIMALVLDANFSKEQQLHFYLQYSYMGFHNGKDIYGFNQAASTYYNKALNDLSEIEFISLVAMLKSPNFYHPVSNPAVHNQRTQKLVKLVRGECSPDGLFDTSYASCG